MRVNTKASLAFSNNQSPKKVYWGGKTQTLRQRQKTLRKAQKISWTYLVFRALTQWRIMVLFIPMCFGLLLLNQGSQGSGTTLFGKGGIGNTALKDASIQARSNPLEESQEGTSDLQLPENGQEKVKTSPPTSQPWSSMVGQWLQNLYEKISPVPGAKTTQKDPISSEEPKDALFKIEGTAAKQTLGEKLLAKVQEIPGFQNPENLKIKCSIQAVSDETIYALKNNQPCFLAEDLMDEAQLKQALEEWKASSAEGFAHSNFKDPKFLSPKIEAHYVNLIYLLGSQAEQGSWSILYDHHDPTWNATSKWEDAKTVGQMAGWLKTQIRELKVRHSENQNLQDWHLVYGGLNLEGRKALPEELAPIKQQLQMYKKAFKKYEEVTTDFQGIAKKTLALFQQYEYPTAPKRYFKFYISPFRSE